MDTEDPRRALAAILRAAIDGIIPRVVDEAARSSGAGPEDIRAYEALMRRLAPAMLDAIAASDEVRAVAFRALATLEIDGIRAVPPVARVGLLEIGLRLARSEVEAATRQRTDAPRVLREMDVLGVQMRAALATGRREPRGRG